MKLKTRACRENDRRSGSRSKGWGTGSGSGIKLTAQHPEPVPVVKMASGVAAEAGVRRDGGLARVSAYSKMHYARNPCLSPEARNPFLHAVFMLTGCRRSRDDGLSPEARNPANRCTTHAVFVASWRRLRRHGGAKY